MVCGSLDLSQGVLKVYAFTRETASSHCSIPLATVTLIVWGSFERGLREPGAERASTKAHYSPWRGAAIHRTRFRRSTARQSLPTHDRKRSAYDAGGRLGDRLSIFRHRAALWTGTF